jgi:hypothetical protein
MAIGFQRIHSFLPFLSLPFPSCPFLSLVLSAWVSRLGFALGTYPWQSFALLSLVIDLRKMTLTAKFFPLVSLAWNRGNALWL